MNFVCIKLRVPLQLRPLPSSTRYSVRAFSAQNQFSVFASPALLCVYRVNVRSSISAKETKQLLYRQVQIKFIDTEPNKNQTKCVKTHAHTLLFITSRAAAAVLKSAH